MSSPADRIQKIFETVIPHCQALGMRVDLSDTDRPEFTLPAGPHLIGDPWRGLMHTAPIVSVLDSVAGAAVMLALPDQDSIATLDLRVDYLRPARADADVIAQARCHRLTRRVAFARAWAWQDDPHRPVAEAILSFMRGANHARMSSGDARQ